jgi:hypothetical protein
MITFVILAPLCFTSVSYAQNAQGDKVLGVKGQCEELTLAGVPSKCAGSGLIYMHLRNGRVLFTVGIDDGRAASFIGERDSQPRPEAYYLYLSRVRIVSKGTEFSANVAGQCITLMSHDGTVWSRIDCEATDENGASYAQGCSTLTS